LRGFVRIRDAEARAPAVFIGPRSRERYTDGAERDAAIEGVSRRALADRNAREPTERPRSKRTSVSDDLSHIRSSPGQRWWSR